jgi:hypothetical protein
MTGMDCYIYQRNKYFNFFHSLVLKMKIGDGALKLVLPLSKECFNSLWGDLDSYKSIYSTLLRD